MYVWGKANRRDRRGRQSAQVTPYLGAAEVAARAVEAAAETQAEEESRR